MNTALSYRPDANYTGRARFIWVFPIVLPIPGRKLRSECYSYVIVEEQSDAPIPSPTETFQVNEGETDVGELFANDDMNNDDQPLVFWIGPDYFSIFSE